MSLTIDDVIELNERMIGYYGLDICFSNGFLGGDFDLDSAVKLRDVLNEIVVKTPRKEFSFRKRDEQ